MATYEHDVVVVGGGMFGSACARHLGTLARAAGQQLDIALIGAEEPGDRADTEVSSDMTGECEYHPMLCLVASHHSCYSVTEIVSLCWKMNVNVSYITITLLNGNHVPLSCCCACYLLSSELCSSVFTSWMDCGLIISD